jgi:hypothetical protein
MSLTSNKIRSALKNAANRITVFSYFPVVGHRVGDHGETAFARLRHVWVDGPCMALVRVVRTDLPTAVQLFAGLVLTPPRL